MWWHNRKVAGSWWWMYYCPKHVEHTRSEINPIFSDIKLVSLFFNCHNDARSNIHKIQVVCSKVTFLSFILFFFWFLFMLNKTLSKFSHGSCKYLHNFCEHENNTQEQNILKWTILKHSLTSSCSQFDGKCNSDLLPSSPNVWKSLHFGSIHWLTLHFEYYFN